LDLNRRKVDVCFLSDQGEHLGLDPAIYAPDPPLPALVPVRKVRSFRVFADKTSAKCGFMR
jgi:hypothetical protein